MGYEDDMEDLKVERKSISAWASFGLPFPRTNN